MQPTDYTRFGLPRYFIKIGISLIVLPIIFMAVTKILYDDIRVEFGSHNVEIMTAMFKSFVILGLSFITFSRSKVENENTFKMRMAGILGAFITGIVMVLISPIFDLFGEGPIESMDSGQLIVTMLLMSMIFRYSAKKAVQKQ
jgi:hypothetical protein